MDSFPEIVGQAAAKRKLEYFLEGFKNNGVSPPLLLNGSRGFGKTTVSRSFGKQLKLNGVIKPFIEVNCAIFGNETHFFDNFLIPHVIDKDVTVFLDEASELSHKVQQLLLTILNPTPGNVTECRFNDAVYKFDLRRVTWIFATTEIQKVYHALVDRLEIVDFEEYTAGELAEIVARNLKGFRIPEDVLLEVASVLRGNARAAQKTAENIKRRLEARQLKSFDSKEWRRFRDDLGILPLGLRQIEVQILRTLEKHGECSLTNLASKLMASKSSLQSGNETYLLQHSLIEIRMRGRRITAKGRKFLNQIESETK